MTFLGFRICLPGLLIFAYRVALPDTFRFWTSFKNSRVQIELGVPSLKKNLRCQDNIKGGNQIQDCIIQLVRAIKHYQSVYYYLSYIAIVDQHNRRKNKKAVKQWHL